MPIKGLTGNQDHKFGSGMPKLGTLFKGSKKRPHPSKPGKFLNGLDLEYFRFEPEPEFAELRELFAQLYGETPDVFERVYLAGSTTDEVFPAFMEEWNGTTLLRRCDREEQTRWYDAQTARHSDAPKPCETLCGRKCACKQIGRLKLIFPRFIERCGILGYVAFSTHSVYDISHIDKQLRDVEFLRGHLAGVPFIFGRSPETFSTANPQKPGERIKVTKSLCWLRPVSEFTRYELLGGLAQPALAAPGIAPAALPVPSAQEGQLQLGDGGRRINEDGEIFDGDDDDEGTVVNWTPSELFELVDDCFEAFPHFQNTLRKYQNDETVSTDLSLIQASAAIRLRRSSEGKYPDQVFANEQRQHNFIERWIGIVPNDAAIIEALKAVSQIPLEHGLIDWRGDLYTAVAAVWSRAGLYKFDEIPFADNTSEIVREIAALICAKAVTIG